MNTIEKLLEKYCPDGVDFKTIQELIEEKKVLTVNPPKKLSKKDYKDKGLFPIVDQGQNFIIAYTDNENIILEKGEYVIFGDHTEAIKYVDFAFTQGADGIKILKTNNDIIAKYFYYVLNNFYEKTGKYTRHFSFLKKTTIPIPPIEIQKEIVKILDKFTLLEAELEAELEARKKQYEYYRDDLLSFGDDEVEWKSLGEVGEMIRGNGLQKKDFTETGFPCVHYGQIYTYYGTFANQTKSFCSLNVAKKLKIAKYGDVLIAGTSENIEDVNKATGWLGDYEIAISGDMFAFRPNLELNGKFLTYTFQTKRYFEHKKKHARGTKVTRVPSKDIEKFKVPIPSLEKQEEIVKILDKFDKLINDISEGLPAEIKARRQQYEYCRNKLLDFKVLEK